jgi:hypothetical protein
MRSALSNQLNFTWRVYPPESWRRRVPLCKPFIPMHLRTNRQKRPSAPLLSPLFSTNRAKYAPRVTSIKSVTCNTAPLLSPLESHSYRFHIWWRKLLLTKSSLPVTSSVINHLRENSKFGKKSPSVSYYLQTSVPVTTSVIYHLRKTPGGPACRLGRYPRPNRSRMEPGKRVLYRRAPARRRSPRRRRGRQRYMKS